MPGIKWESTLDNRKFIQSLGQIQASMNRTATDLRLLGSNFSIDGVVNQLVALSRALRENDAEIAASRARIVQWTEDAEKARAAGDFVKFDNKNLAIEDEKERLEAMIPLSERYRQSMNEILGLWNNLNGQKAPQLFDSQEEYDKVQDLKAEILDLQAKIANFNGSEDELRGLHENLSQLSDELHDSEDKAAQNAASLGSAGRVAADASLHYYELTRKINEQRAAVASLTAKRAEADVELKKAIAGGDVQEIEKARLKYDALSSSVSDAKQQLSSFQIEQSEFAKKMNVMADTADDVGKKIVSSFKNIAAVAGISFGLNEAKDFVKKVADMRAYFQDIESSMKVFLGSAEAGTEFTQKLKDYAYYNMFEFKDLAQASQQMIAYGHDVDSIIGRIDQLSNVAVGTHGSLMELVDAYNRAKSTGVVDARGIQSWAVKGVMIRDVLKEMGEEAVGSSITFEQLNKVLDKVTGEGGMFHNLQLEMMENISAEMGQFQDNFDAMLNEIGEKYQDVITGAIKFGSSLIDNYKEIGKYLMDGVAVYGAYRVALVAANAAEAVNIAWKNRGVISTAGATAATAMETKVLNTNTFSKNANANATKILTAAQKLLNASILTNPYALIGAAAATAVFSIYKLVTAEDAETAARRRANEQIDEFKKKIGEQKERINGYIDTLHSSSATEYEKAVAWESLQKEAAGLTEGYTQAEFAALDMGEAQKKVNENMEDAEFDGLRKKIEQLRLGVENITKGYDQLTEEQKRLFKEAGYQNTMSGFTGEMSERVFAYISALQKAYDEIEQRRKRIEEEARAKAIPIEIRVKEANENIQEKKEILGFYDKAMVLAQKLQETNGTIGYNEAKENFDAYIEELEDGLSKEEEYIKSHPFDQKFKDMHDEKVKVVDEIKALHSTVHENGLDIFSFTAQLTGLSSAWSKAKNMFSNALKNLLPGLHLEGETAVANEDEKFFTIVEAREKAYKRLQKAQKDLTNYDTNNKDKNSTENFVEERTKLVNAVTAAKKAYEDLGGNTKGGGSRVNKAAEQAANREQKLFELRQRQEEEQAAQEIATRNAIEEARIAAIRDDAERELAEQDYQHRKRLQAIEEQEAQMKKKLFEYNKAVWEASNTDSTKKYEIDTEEGKAGWKAIASLSDRNKNIEKAIEEANTKLSGLGIKLPSIDTSDIEKSRESIKNAVDGIKKEIGGIGSNDATITFTADTTQLSDIREQLPEDATVTYTIRKEEIGEIDVPEDALVHVTAVYDGSQLDKLSEIPKDATITIDTQLGNIDVPDIPETATIEVTAQIESGQYDELIEKFGEEVVKPVRIETEGEIVEGDDETITVTVTTDASQLEELKASIPSDVPIRIYAQPEAASFPNIPKDAIVHVGYDVDPSNLKEAAELLPEDYEIEISVDTKALEGLSLPADKEVTITTIVNDEQLSDLKKEMRDVEFSVSADTSSAIAALGEIQAKERTILEEAGKGGIISQLEGMFNGNVDVVARPLIDAAELVKAGWDDAGEGIARVFSIVDSTGNEHNILVTPILPDGSVLSPQEMDSYVSEALNGVDDILAADRLNIVVGIDQGDMGNFGETLHNLHEQLYDLPVDVIEKIRGLYETGDMSGIREALSIYNSLLSTIDGIDEKYASAKHKLSGDSEKELAAQRAVEEANRARQLEERQRAERQQEIEFLKQWGDYEQQKLAITEEYEEKIRKASSPFEAAGLSLKRDEELEKLSSEQLQQKIDWSGVFSSLEGHSKEYLEGLRDQLQGVLDSGDITDVTQLQTIQDKLREINAAISEQGGLFSFVSERQREHNRLVKEAADAQENLNRAQAELGEAIRESGQAELDIRNMLMQNGIDTDVDIDLDLANVFDKGSDEAKKMSELLKKYYESEGRLSKARAKTAKATEENSEAQDKADETLDQAIARHLGNINEWVQTYLSDLPALMDELGIGGSEKVNQGMSAINNAAGAAADFASGNYVGAALKAVAAVKDFGRVVGIGGGNAAKINAAIEKLADRNEILTQSIDRLNDTMSKQGGSKAIETYAKMAEMQKELEENLQEQMRLQMSYHSAHGSFNSYWGGFTDQQLADFNRLNDTDWNGDLSNLTADLAQMLMADADMWQAIEDTGKGGYGERVAEKIKALAEQAGVAKEQVAALNAQLTAGTTADSVFDDFLSSLYDLASGSEDVMDDIAKNWQQMVNNMVVNNLVGEDFRKELEGWYEELANLNKRRQGYNEDGSLIYGLDASGNAIAGMSDEQYKAELERLKADYDGYVNDAQGKIEEFTQLGIIQPIEDAADASLITLDEIRSGWMNILMDMSSDTESWSQDIAKMMTEALIQSQIFDEGWEEQQSDWIDRYNQALKDQSLSDAQRKALLKGLQEEQEAWVDDSRRKVKAIMEMTGYDTAATAEQQNASVQAMERITVDQADELIGRMNAGQMIWEQGNDLSRQIAASIASINDLVSNGVVRGVNDLVGLAITRNQHLSGILEACQGIHSDMNLGLEDLRRDIQKL